MATMRTTSETQNEVTPRPDPTRLTMVASEALRREMLREIEATRELLKSQIEASEQNCGLRIDDITSRQAALATLFETKIEANEHASVARYSQLKNVAEERFSAIHSLFAERELRTKAISDHISEARQENVKLASESRDSRNMILSHEEKFRSVQQQFRDAKTALDAALSAARDAADKQNVANSTASAKSEAAFTKQIDQIGFLAQQTTKAADEKINDLKERVQGLESARKGSYDAVAWIFAGILAITNITTVIFLVSSHVSH